MDQIIANYSASAWNDVVVAIEPVNEPADWSLDVNIIKDYYEFAYQELRTTANSDIVLAIHDAFEEVNWWNGYMPYPEYYNVILDHHAVCLLKQISVAITSYIANCLI